jgi:uncharacterized protein with HEPN domain
MKDERLYLIHVRDCMARITEYVKGGKKEFMKSTLIQDAVLRNLQTFSESTQRLSQEFKSQPPSIGVELPHSEMFWCTIISELMSSESGKLSRRILRPLRKDLRKS